MFGHRRAVAKTVNKLQKELFAICMRHATGAERPPGISPSIRRCAEIYLDFLSLALVWCNPLAAIEMLTMTGDSRAKHANSVETIDFPHSPVAPSLEFYFNFETFHFDFGISEFGALFFAAVFALSEKRKTEAKQRRKIRGKAKAGKVQPADARG